MLILFYIFICLAPASLIAGYIVSTIKKSIAENQQVYYANGKIVSGKKSKGKTIYYR